jgi:hypothetical protein
MTRKPRAHISIFPKYCSRQETHLHSSRTLGTLLNMPVSQIRIIVASSPQATQLFRAPSKVENLYFCRSYTTVCANATGTSRSDCVEKNKMHCSDWLHKVIKPAQGVLSFIWRPVHMASCKLRFGGKAGVAHATLVPCRRGINMEGHSGVKEKGWNIVKRAEKEETPECIHFYSLRPASCSRQRSAHPWLMWTSRR